MSLRHDVVLSRKCDEGREATAVLREKIFDEKLRVPDLLVVFLGLSRPDVGYNGGSGVCWPFARFELLPRGIVRVGILARSPFPISSCVGRRLITLDFIGVR